jgi:hypothetical protein
MTHKQIQSMAARAVVQLTRLAWLAAAAAAVVGSAGCAGPLGTVGAWEKGNLAKPEMSFDADPLRKGFMEHVYSSKESASGGTGVAGGGCGCN